MQIYAVLFRLLLFDTLFLIVGYCLCSFLRNLFPVIKIKVERLNPDEIYKVELDICSVDDCRYKYHENEWVVAGKAEPLVPSSSYVHPDTPSKGSEIMKQPLSFRKVKITNCNDQKEGFVSLY